MLHDVPNLAGSQYSEAAVQVVNQFRDFFYEELLNADRKIIVAISGESGSGKTSVSYQLSKQLMAAFQKGDKPINVKHLYADNFYRENYQMKPPSEREERIKLRNYESIGPDEYDWSMISHILDCFSHGYCCTMPCVDVLNQQIDYLETNFADIDILIIDGLYAVDSRMKADIRILIEGNYYEREGWKDIRESQAGDLKNMIVLREYAAKIIEATQVLSSQDIRRKESLTQARVIRLEKEHTALKETVNNLKRKGINVTEIKI